MNYHSIYLHKFLCRFNSKILSFLLLKSRCRVIPRSYIRLFSIQWYPRITFFFLSLSSIYMCVFFLRYVQIGARYVQLSPFILVILDSFEVKVRKSFHIFGLFQPLIHARTQNYSDYIKNVIDIVLNTMLHKLFQ
jgi:hypothetical protein